MPFFTWNFFQKTVIPSPLLVLQLITPVPQFEFNSLNEAWEE